MKPQDTSPSPTELKCKHCGRPENEHSWGLCMRFTPHPQEKIKSLEVELERLRAEKERLRGTVEEIKSDMKIDRDYYMDGFVNLDDRGHGERDGYRLACTNYLKRLDAALGVDSKAS